MRLTTTDANRYWLLLKDLSNDVKLELIARLSHSMLERNVPEKITAHPFYGAWKDDSAFTAEEMADEIKTGRKSRDKIESFY